MRNKVTVVESHSKTDIGLQPLVDWLDQHESVLEKDLMTTQVVFPINGVLLLLYRQSWDKNIEMFNIWKRGIYNSFR